MYVFTHAGDSQCVAKVTSGVCDFVCMCLFVSLCLSAIWKKNDLSY